MRRQYGGLPAAQFNVPRVQNRRPVQRRGRGRSVRNTVVNAADMALGSSLAERPANIRREIEQQRRELQEKYNQEAAEAEQKRLRREQKKREEWLKRQEALVRPGFRLGHGRPSSNLQRDLEEHQNAIGIEPQEDSPYQQQTDQQLRMLLQQKADRDFERDQLNSELAREGREAYIECRKLETEMRRRLSGSSRSRNTPRDLAASTSNTASPSTSKAGGSGNPKKSANFSRVGQHALPSTSNINARRPVNNADNAPESVTNGSANTRKPGNLGVAQNVSPSTSNINARRPVNLSGTAANAPTSIFNTDGPANTKNPANFLGAAQKASPTSNINVNPANTKKPANFLGAAPIASPSTANRYDALQEMSGHILGSGGNVPTSVTCQTEVDYRERMRAARLRMQAQYNEEVKKAEQAKDQEEHNLAEDVGKLSLK